MNSDIRVFIRTRRRIRNDHRRTTTSRRTGWKRVFEIYRISVSGGCCAAIFYTCLCLRELSRVCCGAANVAVVVGNARYSGRVIRVDEYTAELGERVGLICREIRAVRWRGNSAQQMGRYGRVASRESVVLFNCR